MSLRRSQQAKLLLLARAAAVDILHDHLNRWERQFLRCAAAGEPCVFSNENNFADDIDNKGGPPPYAWVRAELIHWLCTNTQARGLVGDVRITLCGAWIESSLDFSYSDISMALFFHKCAFPERVRIDNATAKSLLFEWCMVDSLMFESARIDGDLRLQCTAVPSGVNLRNVVVRGRLAFLGAQLDAGTSSDGCALSADGMKVEGDAFLACDGERRFTARGKVRLLGADIAGQLSFRGAQLDAGTSSDGCALSAGGVKIGGDAFLDCDGEIPFEAMGTVQFPKAHALADFHFSGCAIRAPVAYAPSRSFVVFVLEDARINGALNLSGQHPTVRSGPMSVHGAVLFGGAYVGELLDSPDVWKSWTEVDLEGFTYDRLNDGHAGDVGGRIKSLIEKPTWGANVYRFRPQPYEQLAKALKESGHVSEARTVLIARELARDKFVPLDNLNVKLWSWLYWIWRFVLRHTIQYGYRPGQALLFLLAIWIMGVGVFTTAYWQRSMAPSNPRQYLDPSYQGLGSEAPQYPDLIPLAYSADALLPIVDLHQESFWLPDPSAHWFGWIAMIYLWAHILSGWVLTTLFVVGFTGIVRKD